MVRQPACRDRLFCRGVPLSSPPLSPSFSCGFLCCLLIIIATGRLLIGMVRKTWLKRSILGLLAVNLMIEVFDFINLPAPLMRIFVAVVAVAGLMILTGRALIRDKDTRPHTWFLRLCILVLAVALVAEILGYSRLAEYLLFSSISTIFLLVLAWMVIPAITGANGCSHSQSTPPEVCPDPQQYPGDYRQNRTDFVPLLPASGCWRC